MISNTGMEVAEICSLPMTFTLDSIWNSRNHIVHNGGEVNIMATICAVENRVKEYLLALAHEDDMA